MITIICGEDSVASRNYLNEVLKLHVEKHGSTVKTITAAECIDLSLQDTQPMSLFEIPIYLLENASKKITRKGSGDLYKSLLTISKSSEISVFIWEANMGKREIKTADLGVVKDFKLSSSVFTLLDQCYPSNLKKFLAEFYSLVTPTTELFMQIMLTRHIRSLLAIRLGEVPTRMQSWQVGKLKAQAFKWDTKNLLDFYEKLLSIEVRLKTGKAVYTVGESLSLLSCYYL
ncbi:MAG: hypothetical protein WBC38_01105 [Microgenomates group bacterium]|jgi:DNA polymerase III delta subunit